MSVENAIDGAFTVYQCEHDGKTVTVNTQYEMQRFLDSTLGKGKYDPATTIKEIIVWKTGDQAHSFVTGRMAQYMKSCLGNIVNTVIGLK